jgi:hypothetical protein
MSMIVKLSVALTLCLPVLGAFAETGLLPIGVCDLPEPGVYVTRTCSYQGYVHEILQHAGLGYSRFPLDKLQESLPSLRILVTTGNAALSAEASAALDAWVTQGGVLIGVGGVCGVPDWFGVTLDHPANIMWHGDTPCTLGEGYMAPMPDSGALAPAAPFPLHFFNGIAVRPTVCRVLAMALDAHQRPTPHPAMTENPHGKGRCILIAPDITGSVVRIQQGTAITRDHVPAPDGSAPITDGVLITEDGMALDWIFDRHPVPGAGELQSFTEPIADIWREVLLRTVFQVAQEGRVAVPILWMYPRNLPAIGHLSHDSDGNDPIGAQKMLEHLEQAQVHSTWCILLPGYPKELIQKIHDAGHELATHYDAFSKFTDWRQERFNEQVDTLTALFGEAPVTNKNHVLRWEGDTEFYGWCQAKGIQVDQSKGDCQTGEAGFLFGTCHPYFPVAPDGKPYDVFELCTLTQDIIMTVPVPFVDMIMDTAIRHHGVAHFLFHPAHQVLPTVTDAMLNVLARGKACGLEWWMARDISTWERARRTAVWSTYATEEKDGHGKATVAFRTDRPLPQATVLWLAPDKPQAGVDGKPENTQTVERWGFKFEAVTNDLLPGRPYELSLAW